MGSSPPEEHQFKPGQSGNPGGRPKSKLVSSAYRKLLEAADPKTKKLIAEAIARQIVKKALRGDLAAVKEITDRTEGKAVQPLMQGGMEDQPVQIIVKTGKY